MTAYAAFLRVYEPLAAFSGAERRRWDTLAARGEALSVEQGVELERRAGLLALARLPATLPDLPEQAFVTELDGVRLVCPWRTRLRGLQALVDFRSDLPDEVADAFVSRAVAEQAEDALARWRRDHPDLRTHVLSNSWRVPLQWFVLVDGQERAVTPGTPGGGRGAPPGRRTGRSLVYRTSMSRSRRRVARTLDVLRRTVDEDAAIGSVRDLGRWLEDFHPRSMVELDYGGLVHLLDDAQLAQDESARDVAAAVAALAQGRTDEASAAYDRVSARMKALEAVESAN